MGAGLRTCADPNDARDVPRKPARVHLVAPARWKSADASARRRIDRTVLMPAPTHWVRSRVVSGRTTSSAPSSSAEGWLLPPTWPLDRWHVTAAAGLRRVAGIRITLWAQARRMSWPGWAGAYRHRLAAGIAIGAVAGLACLSLQLRMSPPGMRPTPAGTPALTPATPAHAASPRSLPAMPIPAPVVAAPVAASEPATPAALRPGSAETGRSLISDVSTMDLMMPIEEPDLDIASRQSLWSEVGKAYGVDPLLLYSVALVESKALYPDGKVAPTPWLFRVNDHLVRGQRHDVQLAMAAASQFNSAVQDVGIMQVYYPMHRDAVRDPLALLNPRTNISVAAKILRDGMHETRDQVLGVGYYHSHTPALARDYGTAVLTVYQRLKAIHRPLAHGQLVAR
ncbi:transglycosylase SLT domain-containing protein [Rhodanobacter sp. B04]|uniref:transglycosylase SLT domain-containing protein n=1 Tax=Rhodanobacter sp. B04 TaxID=1945860 RepID=UPI0020C3E7EC|nr:transglycosylase SLT domain-containing protein [Rhodanobacter sp. B04]